MLQPALLAHCQAEGSSLHGCGSLVLLPSLGVAVQGWRQQCQGAATATPSGESQDYRDPQLMSELATKQ